MSKLPWEERVTMLQINPDAASRDDVARLAEQVVAYEDSLREIADHGCDNAAPKTCKETYPTNREEWCAACIATSVLGGNHD